MRERPRSTRERGIGRALGATAVGLLVLALGTGQATPSESPHAASFAREAVAADHPLASAAGAEILREGGNAADAAAATMLALGVVSPASSGLGGGGFALYYRASDHSLTFLDFRERAPGAATPDMFAARPGEDDATAAARSQTGGLAIAVPGEPAGIAQLVEQLGSGRVTRARIAAPAERLAREGFAPSRYVREASGYVRDALRADRLLQRWIGDAPALAEGARLQNPELAATLRTFGRQGAQPFYRGAIARAIVEASRARGGVLTMADLAAYEVREREPLRASRFGHEWVTAPPPSAGGFSILQSLALLERWAPADGFREGPAFRHALTQSWVGAFADRAAHLGDPDHAALPMVELMDEARLAERAEGYDPHRARSFAEWDQPLPGRDAPSGATPEGGGTSHLCVVDDEGNIAAITTTVNLLFGARVTAAGMVLNDEMDDFAREVGAQNAFGLPGGAANLPAPGRRPVSSMSPTIVFREGAPVLCVGASGGSRILTATEQVALFHLLLRDTVGDAVARPRIHHQGLPATTLVEAGLDPAIRAGLWGRGHRLANQGTLASVQAIGIERTASGRVLHAASDPRKDAEPRGR